MYTTDKKINHNERNQIIYAPRKYEKKKISGSAWFHCLKKKLAVAEKTSLNETTLIKVKALI